jgi:hypothetical protein
MAARLLLHTRLGGSTDGARRGAWPQGLTAAMGSTKAGHGEHRVGHGRERSRRWASPHSDEPQRECKLRRRVCAAAQRRPGLVRPDFGHGERVQRRARQEARRVGMDRGRSELTMSERRAGSEKLQASSGLHTMRRIRRGRIMGTTYSGGRRDSTALGELGTWQQGRCSVAMATRFGKEGSRGAERAGCHGKSELGQGLRERLIARRGYGVCSCAEGCARARCLGQGVVGRWTRKKRGTGKIVASTSLLHARTWQGRVGHARRLRRHDDGWGKAQLGADAPHGALLARAGRGRATSSRACTRGRRAGGRASAAAAGAHAGLAARVWARWWATHG